MEWRAMLNRNFRPHAKSNHSSCILVFTDNRLASLISEEHGHKVFVVVVKIVSIVCPVVDLRKQNDLNYLLEDGEGAIDSKPEPELEIVEI